MAATFPGQFWACGIVIATALYGTGAQAAVAPPPDPELAAAAFVDACRRGLRDPAIFERAIRNAAPGYRRIEDAGGYQRYRATRLGIDYRPNERCTIMVYAPSIEEAEQVVAAISRLESLPVPRGIVNRSLTERYYGWPADSAQGGVQMYGSLVNPRPGPRMEPAPFRLFVSATLGPA